MPTKPQPSELELQILALLWEHGPRTARQVLEQLPDGKKRAYTSILSVMQVMEKKGLLRISDRQGRANIYKPTVAKNKVLQPMLRGLVQRVFGGRPAVAVQQLLSESDVSPKELGEIRKMLDEIEKKSGGGK